MPQSVLVEATAPQRPALAPSRQVWRLDAGPQTLVLVSEDKCLPQATYWGARLPASEDLEAIHAGAALDITGGMLDALPALSLCPEASGSFPGQPGLVCRDADGSPLFPSFRLVSSDNTDTAEGLRITCADAAAGLTLHFRFESDAETGLIVAETRLVAKGPIWLDWLAAPVLPGPQVSTEMIDIAGRWCGEFQCTRTPWSAGQRVRDNRTGRSDHAHFPGLLLPATGTTNTHGAAWAMQYGWPGGHRMVAEELQDGRRQVQFGHAPGSERRAGTEFASAPLYLAYSETGLNGCAVAFQRHLRDRVITWPTPVTDRPVHYNCWEAVYFDHDLETLKDIAGRAAAIGAERFVLDDGWFGQRDDDTSSLGDWQVDRRKFPDGLAPLIAHIRDLGMGFGLWVEPEMVNANSDLFRAHPDWVLGPGAQIEGRQQRVLDMARPEVRQHLFERLAALLSDHAIDYLKWDHNRVLPMPDAAQARGTCALLARLRTAFPQVEIESCASGGGRMDFGILRHTQRVWLSDSNDALERLRIQHDAALFLPAMVTGSHVGPRRCHTSGRVLDIGFRAWVAAQRHMGFEMDPRELDPRETEVLKAVTAWWKANRGWMAAADLLRLDSDDPAVMAEQHISRDAKRFVVFAGKASSSAQIAPRPLRLTALDPEARYQVTLVNRDRIPRLSRGTPALKHGPLHVSGAWLMHHGLSLPWSFPETMWVLEGERQ